MSTNKTDKADKTEVPFQVVVKNNKGEVLTPNKKSILAVEVGRVTISITDCDTSVVVLPILIDKRQNAIKSKKMGRNVNIAMGENGGETTIYTTWPDNQIKVVVVDKNGKLQVWEVSLTSQFGQIFLTTILQHDVQCSVENGKIICPKLNKWGTLLNILNNEITASVVFQKKSP